MSRSLDGDDPFEEEEYRRRCAQDRLDRAREQASLHTEFGGVRVIVEPKGDAHIPPDVAERQRRFYHELLREETDGQAG